MEKWCSSCISQKCDSCEILKAYMPTCKKCGSNCTDTINGECDRCIELRTTKRALWLARAERARIEARDCSYSITKRKFLVQNWHWVERKCREKAEEFK